MKKIFFCVLFFICFHSLSAQIINADERLDEYLPKLNNKNVALVCNHTSVVKDKHLINLLVENKINLSLVFTPEHGLTGLSEAGELVGDSSLNIDGKKIKVVSLYGSNKKPSQQQMRGIDIVVFDIQDVGCRFYTYISTLEYVMLACIENNAPLLVLDRPNPNNYVDGPVLQKEYKSFVGMQSIPICYGLTIGEYATMINEEHWVDKERKCDLQIVRLLNYERDMEVSLPIPPSPNLRTDKAIRNYPTLCFFEGTSLSVGRGTNTPFEIVGYKPKRSKAIKWKQIDITEKKIDVSLIITIYREYNGGKKFFNNFFDKLAGNSTFRKAIVNHKTEAEIRKSWQKDIENYNSIRGKYLLY